MELDGDEARSRVSQTKVVTNPVHRFAVALDVSVSCRSAPWRRIVSFRAMASFHGS